MNIKMFRLYVAALLAVGVSTVSWGAGLFSTFPQVGQGSFCAAIVGPGPTTGGTTGQGAGSVTAGSTYCAQTVPAGPTVVTGSEIIPADTNIQGTQTVGLTLASLNALPTFYQLLSAVNATNTVVISPKIGALIISAAAALSPTTITLPASPIDGQQLRLSGNQNIAALTITPSAGNFIDATAKAVSLTTSTTGSYGFTFVYSLVNNTWMRLQ